MKRNRLWMVLLAYMMLFNFCQPGWAKEDVQKPSKKQLEKIIADFDKYAEKGMKDWQIPGMAIAIVQEDEIIYSKAFGVKCAGRPEPVTTHTIFQIGSTSKAFTAALVAMMVDEGKINWDDKVIDHIPDFRMYDPWVTREFMVYDLLSQHSGMAPYSADAQSFLGFDRDHIIYSLRFIKPESSFRSKFAYVNNLFLVGGKIVEKYTQKSWEEALKERIFEPLGMSETSADVKSYCQGKDVAAPHNFQNGKATAVPMDLEWPYIYGPAGGINSNVIDMSKWLRLQIYDGLFEGKQIITAKNMDFTHSPKTIAMTDVNNGNKYYCLSWVYDETRPYPTIWHNGGTTGCHTMLAFWPHAKVGIVILTNLCPNQLAECLAKRFGDLYFGNPQRDWSAEELDKSKKAKQEAEKTKPVLPAKIMPPMPLDNYAGKYHNDIYQDMTVEKRQDALVLTLGQNKTSFALKHWDRDVFLICFPLAGDGESESFVHFHLDETGKVKTAVLDMFNKDGCGVFEK